MPKTMTPDEAKEYKDKVDALTEEAKAHWKDLQWHAEMAAELTDTIEWGFEHENIVDLLTDVEDVGFEGQAYVREVRGLKAYWVARGGYIQESTLREDVFAIVRDTIGFHVSEMEDKMETNFGPTQQRVIDLAIKRKSAEINLRVLRAYQAAVPSTSPYYTAAAGLSLATLNTAIREVGDQIGVGNVTIVGRRTMTDKIVDGVVSLGSGYGAFLPETNEQLLRRGVLGTYRGSQIVTLKNFRDDNNDAFFPANELWVLGEGSSKAAFFGAPKEKEFVEQDNWFWHYLQRQDFGVVVYRPEFTRRIIDSNETA